MHDHSGRLVDYEQIIVLEQNIEPDVLRLRRRGYGIGPVNVDFFPGVRVVRRFDRFAIHLDVVLLDQSLNGAARDRRKL